MSDKEKIKYYLEKKGISKNKFYTKTGLSVGFLDSGNSLGVDKAKIIINTYPDLSLEWLVLGTGEMIRENGTRKQDTDILQEKERTIALLEENNALLRKNAALLEEKIAFLKEEYTKKIENNASSRKSAGTADVHAIFPQL